MARDGEQFGAFDSYADNRKIGAGGFSRVYSVRKGAFLYAMKIPKMELLDEDESDGTIGAGVKDSFIKEIGIWARLSETVPDDVVRLIDYNTVPYPWMVMELADLDYDRHIKNGNADPKDIIGLLDSLQHIHDQGIVHRDIKPKNILRINGKWKFSDFGLSKISKAMTTTGTGKGTVYYMAPEQLTKKNGSIDERTDVWQMGIVLYNILTGGRFPYHGDDEDEVRLEIATEGADLSNVPSDYQRILSKSLSFGKDDRYQTAEEFRDALKEIDAGFEVPVNPVKKSDRNLNTDTQLNNEFPTSSTIVREPDPF